jgi:hypothetical protein
LDVFICNGVKRGLPHSSFGVTNRKSLLFAWLQMQSCFVRLDKEGCHTPLLVSLIENLYCLPGFKCKVVL